MGQPGYRYLDPAFPAGYAESLLRLCERFGRYGTYAEESVADDIGEGLSQRHDAVLNFLKTGARQGRSAALADLVARTNYFREEYAYADVLTEGIEPFLRYQGFAEAAREIHGRPLIEPNIVYANILLPGQELAVHTDVPEFRGANRRKDPQWLLVAMHHSGLFERWRMPIATAVAWFGNARGGEFVFHPDGPQAPPLALPARHNTAIVLDTDSVFHGVDPVHETGQPLPALRPGMQLVHSGDGKWQVESEAGVLARYDWDELRFSISWKAYCYRDEDERRSVREHRDDLSRASVLDTLIADLRSRGRLGANLPDETGLALTIIDEYIVYPRSGPAPTTGA